MHLYIVRHGVTQHTVERRHSGQNEVPLNDQGRQQAQAIAERLRKQPFDAIIASDLTRTRQTAEAIAAHHAHIAIQFDPDLREFHQGDWDGLTHEEIMERDPVTRERWMADAVSTLIPNGESVVALQERAIRAVDRWHDTYPDGNVLWVTHAGFIGALFCYLLGMELRRRWQFRAHPASYTHVEIGLARFPDSPSRLYSFLHTFGDVGHLPEDNIW